MAAPVERVNPRCTVDARGCVFCGGREFASRPIIGDALAAAWALGETERRWFDEREGNYCAGCGMTLRMRMLVWTLRQVAPRLAGLDVLHVNQVNKLDAVLREAASVVATIYRAGLPPGERTGALINEDLQALTFADRCFDLAIQSETIEHVHDYRTALAELHRVLKPGGWLVYTVPLLHDRRTRRRAVIEDGVTQHLLPPSWHGCEAEDLVLWEFGADLLQERAAAIHRLDYDDFSRNPTIFAIAEQKR
ncbi:MAG: class I SAM-dependent methyltransferase [Burkholderiales bacterium]